MAGRGKSPTPSPPPTAVMTTTSTGAAVGGAGIGAAVGGAGMGGAAMGRVAPGNLCLVQFMWQPLTQMSYPKVTLLTSLGVRVFTIPHLFDLNFLITLPFFEYPLCAFS